MRFLSIDVSSCEILNYIPLKSIRKRERFVWVFLTYLGTSMLCLYVAYLLADVAWYNIEFYCYSSENPTGVFFSRFFAAIFSFAFGFGATPVCIYIGLFILKWIGICFLEVFCGSYSNVSSRRPSGRGNAEQPANSTGINGILYATDGENEVVAVYKYKILILVYVTE